MALLGMLDELLHDDSITEILVNGPDAIYFERNGKLQLWQKKFDNENEIYQLVDTILSPLGRRISKSSPYTDARLADGSRVNIIVPPVSLTGPMITIRKFSSVRKSVAYLIEQGSLSPQMLEFLKLCVELKKNIVVFGGTGSGKTTLLNMLSSFIPGDERVITIEDTAELQLTHANIGRLEASPPNADGANGVTIRRLLVNALRMRPDRIIIGECRSEEALDMLQAMNTGHQGSMATLHANSPRDCLKRLETMVLMSGFDLPLRAIREQIATAIHVLVHISRFPQGSRKIASINEITGMEGDTITLAPIYEYSPDGTGYDAGGVFKATQMIPSFVEEAITRGKAVNRSMFA